MTKLANRLSAIVYSLFSACVIVTGIKPLQAFATGNGFIMPSRNIVCFSYGQSPKQFLRCEIRSGLKPMPPKPSSCQFDWGGGFLLTTDRQKAEILCISDTVYSPDFAILNYGKTWRKNGFSCNSTTNGLTCTNGKGNGFFMNREQWRAF